MAEKEGFFHTLMGQVVAGLTFIFAINTKKLWDEVMTRSGSLISEYAKSGLYKADLAQEWVRKEINAILWAMAKMTMAFAFVVTVFVLLGVHLEHRVLIAVGALIGGVYMILLWGMLSALAAVFVTATKLGTSLISTIGGGILEKVRLKKPGSESFEVDLANTREYLRNKVFVVIPIFMFGMTLLVAWPNWMTLGFVLCLAVPAFTIAMAAAYKGWSTDRGWKIVSLACLVLIFFFVLSFLLQMVSPETFDSLGLAHFSNWFSSNDYRAENSFWGDGWLAICITIAAVGGILWVIAGSIEGEAGKRLSYGVKVVSAVAIILVFVFRGPFTDVARAQYEKYSHNPDRSSKKAPAAKAPAAKKPNFPSYAKTSPGTPNTQKAPDNVPYIPKSKDKTLGKPEVPSKPKSKDKPSSIVKKSTPEQGDGYDEAIRYLDEVGL